MDKTARRELIEIMAQRLGRGALATTLGAPAQLLEEWIDGRETIPQRYLVNLVMLVGDAPD